MIAIAVPSDGERPPARSREIVEWSMPVRIAKVRWLMPRSAIASRSQPPKSPSAMRLGRTRSSTSRCPHHVDLGRGQREPWRAMAKRECLSPPVNTRQGTVSPVAQRGGTATVGTSALPSLPRMLGDDMRSPLASRIRGCTYLTTDCPASITAVHMFRNTKGTRPDRRLRLESRR